MAGQPSILVVEDTEPLRMILELALAEAGYEVIGVANGAEALRQCADRRLDAALLDIGLPDMDGFELAARLRATKEGETMPMIFMTARREPEMPAQVAAAGGVGLLLKPFRLGELLQHVARCLPDHLVEATPATARPLPEGLANGGFIPELVSPAMKNERLALLEEKLAWLQRHVTEQDKAMLELAGEIDRLKKQVTELRAKLAADPGEPAEADEHPPHY
jgi:DNA-binding response OmpR family regulator